MPATSVKVFHSAMNGAPTLSGSAGALLSVLDSCLSDGWGSKTMTTGAISGGVATLNYTSTAAPEVGSVILVAGATPTSLNGEKKVTAIAAGSVSFPTVEADGSITGTVTFKMAALGFTKSYTGTNKRAFKSSDIASTGCFLRVDDTGTTTARVVGYETMSDVDTGTGPFPTSTQLSGGYWWPKSNTADTSARNWVLVGDERTFYLYVSPHPTTYAGQGVTFAFGDLISNKSGDAWSCVLAGGDSSAVATTTSNVSACVGYAQPTSTATAWAVARSHVAIGGAQLGYQTSGHAVASAYSGTTAYNTRSYAFPNGADNGLLLSEVLFANNSAIRGVVPGAYHTPLLVGGYFSTNDSILGTGSFSGKKMLALRTGSPAAATYGVLFLDVTGPWR